MSGRYGPNNALPFLKKGRTMPPPAFPVSDDPTEPTEEVTLTEAVAPRREKAMGFFDHLEELRGTLIKCAVAYTLFAVLIGCYMAEFNGWLLKPWVWTISG